MAEKKGRERVPEAVVDAVSDLIRGSAQKLEAVDEENEGYSTADIVREVHATAFREVKEYIGVVFDDWVAGLVPKVLGATPKPGTKAGPSWWQPLLPELLLPAYFSIPPERDAKGRALGQPRWKRDRKATPNELKRMIEHERSDIIGRQTELQKHVVVMETALRRGCDPDEPIGNVMDDDGPTPRHPEGPRPAA